MIVNASMATASRSLMIETGWNKWFPEQKEKIAEQVFYTDNKVLYSNIKNITSTNATVTIETENVISIADVSIAPLKSDSILVNISCIIDASSNPFKRVYHYFKAVEIKNSLNKIASSFKSFAENFKLVYGFDVRRTKLMDSSMIAIKASVNNYPTLQDIYSKIEILEKYASSNNASPTDFPMLNIFRTDSNAYNFMVALPINKPLNATGEILYKQMLPKGNFVATDSIYGGFEKLDNLFASFIKMKEDYQMMSPAIPFQSLITDRRKETDTTKWVTRFYYPIF